MPHSFTGALVGGLLALLLPASVHAHHVVAEHGIAPVLPRTIASVDLSGATFDAGGRSGSWMLVTPSFEWRAFRRLSLFAALPFGQVRFEDGTRSTGLGDLPVSAKVSVVETAHGGLLLSAGLGAELPTGDEDAGLGGGHLELAPFLTASSVLSSRGRVSLIAYGLTALSFAVSGHEHAAADAHTADGHTHDGHSHGAELAQGSVFNPHGEREAYGRLMLAAILGRSHLAAGTEGAAVLRGRGDGQVALRAELGRLVSENIRLLVAADATVLGERRYGVRGRVGAACLF